jgi:hypothetical protein
VWANRALTLNRASGSAWAALSIAELSQTPPDMRGALDAGLKAATYGPRCSSCQTALTAVLSATLSLTVSLEVRKLDPLLLGPSINAATALHTLNRSGEARPLVEDVLHMEADMPPALWIKTMILTDPGRLDEATQLLTRPETLVAEKRLPEESYVLAQSFFGYTAMDTIPYLVRHGKRWNQRSSCVPSASRPEWCRCTTTMCFDWMRAWSRSGPIRGFKTSFRERARSSRRK